MSPFWTDVRTLVSVARQIVGKNPPVINKNVKYIVRNIIIHACTYMYVMHVEAASLEKSQVHAL